LIPFDTYGSVGRAEIYVGSHDTKQLPPLNMNAYFSLAHNSGAYKQAAVVVVVAAVAVVVGCSHGDILNLT